MNASNGEAGCLGFSDWCLPGVTDVGNDGATYTNFYQGVDYGYNITVKGEVASLWYDTLGNTAYFDTAGNPTGCAGAPTYCLTNTGPFSNLQSYDYWSGVEYAPNTGNAWYFSTSHGGQGNGNKYNVLYGWAVRSGDVSAVPVPAAVWLFGSGLIGLLGVARRKR